MNLHKINCFIKKVYPGHKINIKYFRDKSKAAYLMTADAFKSPPEININRSKIKRINRCKLSVGLSNEHYFKGAILHELGHIKKFHCGFTSEQEFEAHLFAMKIAKKLKMRRVLKGLLHWLWSFGGNRFVNKNMQIYRNIYNQFLQDENFRREYGRFFKGIKVLHIFMNMD